MLLIELFIIQDYKVQHPLKQIQIPNVIIPIVTTYYDNVNNNEKV